MQQKNTEYREGLIERIEGAIGTLKDMPYSEISTETLSKIYQFTKNAEINEDLLNKYEKR